MSDILFKKGLEKSLPSLEERDQGTFYVTTDSGKIMLGDSTWEDTNKIKEEFNKKEKVISISLNDLDDRIVNIHNNNELLTNNINNIKSDINLLQIISNDALTKTVNNDSNIKKINKDITEIKNDISAILETFVTKENFDKHISDFEEITSGSIESFDTFKEISDWVEEHGKEISNTLKSYVLDDTYTQYTSSTETNISTIQQSVDNNTKSIDDIIKNSENFVVQDDFESIQNQINGINTNLNNFVNLNTEQTISGKKNYTNHIGINNKTIISSTIDPGELKVLHNNSSKGLIIRTKNSNESILPLEILSTDGYNSRQYNFPKSSGNVSIGAKINNVVSNTNLDDGIIDLGSGFTKSIKINGITSNSTSDGIIDLGVDFIKPLEVTYDELKELYDLSKLTPGQQYRITDYSTIISHNDAISSNNVFDVVVTALYKNELSENAHACHPKGDRILNGSSEKSFLKVNEKFSPFSWSTVDESSDLSYEIYKYSIKNNISFGEYSIVGNGYTVRPTEGSLRISVSEDPQNGSDVYMVGIEVCDGNNGNVVAAHDYSVKEIKQSSSTTIKYYFSNLENKDYFLRFLFLKPSSSTNNVHLITEIVDCTKSYFSGVDIQKWEIKYDINNDSSKYEWTNTTDGKGVIYYMKDEWGNECYYDFKNIKFKRTKEFLSQYSQLSNNSEVNFSETEKYFFTFDYNGTDDSLNKGTYKCELNQIGKCMSGKTMLLNNTIFLGNGNSNNKLGENNKNNIFGFDSYNNVIGVNFQNNILPMKFTYNTVGNGFANNTYLNYFRYSNVGHLVSNNVFNGYVTDTIIMNNVKNNTFNSHVYNSKIGNYVQRCTFNGYVGYCDIGDATQNVINIPTLYKIHIGQYILRSDDSNSPLDLNVVTDENGIIISNILKNVNVENDNSDDIIYLCKNNEGNYCIFKKVDILNNIKNLNDKVSRLENNEGLTEYIDEKFSSLTSNVEEIIIENERIVAESLIDLKNNYYTKTEVEEIIINTVTNLLNNQ